MLLWLCYDYFEVAKMIIGIRIQEARKVKGWTQKELAEKLGLATGTVQQYELGKRSPSIETLKKIAELLNVSVDDLTSTSEYEDEYELICDTLRNARLKVEPTGFNHGGGPDGDTFYVWHEDDAEDPELREEIEYSRLAEIVHQVLTDAEANKKLYIEKRLETELFWPKGWQPK